MLDTVVEKKERARNVPMTEILGLMSMETTSCNSDIRSII